MNPLDIRTVLFSQLITDAVCAAVLAFLWWQNRNRYAGMFFLVGDFFLQTSAILAIILRGSIPDWVSIGLSSPLVIAGAFLGYLGLERFVGKRSAQVHNYILLGVFLLVNSYFVFLHPNLEVRNLTVSLGLLVLCAQCTWLMLRHARRGLSRTTQAVGWVFALFCLVSLIRISVVLAIPQRSNDFFQSGFYDTLTLMAYQILLILLTFGLALMVNRRLLYEVKSQEDKFIKVFQSSPDAILITRLSDGLILNVNRGFEELTGYPSSEAIGKSTLDLSLWVKETDRQQVIDELSARGEVQGREFQFRAKSGRELTGLLHAEILVVEDEQLMLSSLSDITERRQAEAAVRSLAHFPSENPNPVLRIARGGKLLYANEAAFALLADWKLQVGEPAPDVLKSPAGEVFATHATKTVELVCKGRTFSIAIEPAPEDEYVNLYGSDITERKRAEGELQRTLDELKRSNSELEQFAYVASHDLQEPLRMVSSYMQLLERRYKGKLDKEADEFIGFAVDGAGRMQRLINDLLAYSRVGTRGQPFVTTSCDAALMQALDNLQVAIRESKAKITRDPLPEVLADGTQLVQLFQNLVGNAVKFHGDKVARVRISAEAHENEWVFAVRDNGIGIEPQYADRIFIIFQRLNSREKYAGTGIGLAMCKKIVQHHGGRIWVESKSGQGATFYFTLPRTEGGR